MMSMNSTKYIFRKWLFKCFINNVPLFFGYLKCNFPDSLPVFRKYLKIFQSLRRKEYDICFLETCIEDGIIPSFIYKQKLFECLSNTEIRNVHLKVLRRMLEIGKGRRKEIAVQLSWIRLAMYEVIGDDCFSLCINMLINISQKVLKDKMKTQLKK